MSSDPGADIASDLRAAARSLEVFHAELQAYQASVVRARWKAADDERANLHDSLDKYLDSLGCAHKAMERLRREAGG